MGIDIYINITLEVKRKGESRKKKRAPRTSGVGKKGRQKRQTGPPSKRRKAKEGE